MRRRSQYVIVFVLALGLVTGAVGPGWALDNPYVSTVIRTLSGAYSNQLTATVTRNGDTYHYLYSLVYKQSYNGSVLSSFTVGNPKKIASWGWGCSESSLKLGTITDGLGHFTDSVLWNSGTVLPDASGNKVVTFWYDSFCPYTEVSVSLLGGRQSTGTTLGMTPEPCSLLTMAFGLGGVLWTRLRRRS